jgi:hypothetical protein
MTNQVTTAATAGHFPCPCGIMLSSQIDARHQVPCENHTEQAANRWVAQIIEE